jgi:hypothetical protein
MVHTSVDISPRTSHGQCRIVRVLDATSRDMIILDECYFSLGKSGGLRNCAVAPLNKQGKTVSRHVPFLHAVTRGPMPGFPHAACGMLVSDIVAFTPLAFASGLLSQESWRRSPESGV